jgi:hypothetical protein
MQLPRPRKRTNIDLRGSFAPARGDHRRLDRGARAFRVQVSAVDFNRTMQTSETFVRTAALCAPRKPGSRI